MIFRGGAAQQLPHRRDLRPLQRQGRRRSFLFGIMFIIIIISSSSSRAVLLFIIIIITIIMIIITTIMMTICTTTSNSSSSSSRGTRPILAAPRLHGAAASAPFVVVYVCACVCLYVIGIVCYILCCTCVLYVYSSTLSYMCASIYDCCCYYCVIVPCWRRRPSFRRGHSGCLGESRNGPPDLPMKSEPPIPTGAPDNQFRQCNIN